VIVFRHEDRSLVTVGSIAKTPAHREAIGNFADCSLEASPIRSEIRHVEFDALKKLLRHGVGMLVRVEDVRTVAVKHLRQRGDEAFAVRTANEKGGSILHGEGCSR
jgi:hypothetical protein